MKKVKVELGSRSYGIYVEAGLTGGGTDFPFMSGLSRCFVLTDGNVGGLYTEVISDFLSGPRPEFVIESIEPGEGSKNLDTMKALYASCVKAGLDRSSAIIAFGGGVPGDMAGFLAATYMRGISYVQVPTSLLAMVDSSVGGKTGVDLPEGKNLVGAFWQPSGVLIDPRFLDTLPERELLCGLAEVVKYGVILDESFFSYLENNVDGLGRLDLEVYSELIARCCRLKADVVEADEREGGLRAILNYGHTFGHAIETVTGYSRFRHGEAVSIGMQMAADFAVSSGHLSRDDAERQEELLRRIGLPVSVGGVNSEDILGAMGTDKKKVGGSLKLIIPDRIGHVDLLSDPDPALLRGVIGGRCVDARA